MSGRPATSSGRESDNSASTVPVVLVPLSPHQDLTTTSPLPLGSLFRQTAPHSGPGPYTQVSLLLNPGSNHPWRPSVPLPELSACWTRGSLSLFLGGGARVLFVPHGCSARATPLPGSLRPGVETAMLPMVGGGNTQTLAGQKPFPQAEGCSGRQPPTGGPGNSPQ